MAAFAYYFVRTLGGSTRVVAALMFVTLMGLISVVASSVRFGILYPLFGGIQNPADVARPSSLWSSIEVLFGMIAACLPAFRTLIRKAADSRKGTGAGGTSGMRSSGRARAGDHHPEDEGAAVLGNSAKAAYVEVELQHTRKPSVAVELEPHSLV